MTDQERAAMQQALEALEEIEWSNDSQWQSDRAKVAITALRAALAQQAEPVQLRELLIQAASMAVAAERAGKYGGASWVADAVLEDCPKQQAEQEPVAKMTAGRAMYFMERFKREEKMLGPNEQAALDFVISMLDPATVLPDKPVAWIDALKDAFFEGFTSVATYNDTLLNSPEEAWENYKPPRAAPPQRKPLTKEKIMRAFYAVKKTP